MDLSIYFTSEQLHLQLQKNPIQSCRQKLCGNLIFSYCQPFLPTLSTHYLIPVKALQQGWRWGRIRCPLKCIHEGYLQSILHAQCELTHWQGFTWRTLTSCPAGLQWHTLHSKLRSCVWKYMWKFSMRTSFAGKCLNCNSSLSTFRFFMGRWKLCIPDWRGLGQGWERTKYLGCFHSQERESGYKWNRRFSMWWLLQS